MSAGFKFPEVELLIGGRKYLVTGAFARKFPLFVLTLSGLDNVDEAQELVGLDVFIPESLFLPLEEGEYYYKDLIGLPVYSNGEHIGSVVMLHDFGAATEVIELLLLSGKKVMLPFTKECVTNINLTQELVEVVFPQEI